MLHDAVTATQIQQKRRSQTWSFVTWLIAFLPALFVLVTWDSDGKLTHSAYVMRHYSLPVTICELVIIWAAIRSGWRLENSFQRLSRLTIGLIVIWVCAALISALSASSQLGVSLLITFRYMLHGLFFTALVGMAERLTQQNWQETAKIFVAGAMAYVALIVLFTFVMPHPDKFDWVKRLPSATNIRQIGYYVAIFSVAPLTVMLFGQGRNAWICGICFGILIAFISWSGSRAALLGIVSGGTIALFVIRPIPKWNRIYNTVGFTIAGLVASIPIPLPAPEFGILRILFSTNSLGNISSGRTELWKHTINEIMKNPQGHGAGTFRGNMELIYGSSLNHPHQFFLQYLYDWGLIGGTAGLLLIGILVFTMLSLSRKVEPATGYIGLAGLFTILSVAMIDGALFVPLSIVMVLFLIVPIFADGNRWLKVPMQSAT